MILPATTGLAPLVGLDWWNPQAWLQSLGGLLSGAYSAGTAVKDALGGVLTIFEQFFRIFTDTGHFIQDSVGWLTNALFPPELQTWFLGTMGAPGASWDPTQIYENVYQAVQAPALLIAGAAAASRLARNSLDQRLPATHSLVDVLPRFILTVGVIGVPGTHVALAYTVIAWVLNASVLVAGELFRVILHASLLEGVRRGEGWFSHVYQVLANAGHSMVAVVVGGIPLLILLLYAAFLMVVRVIMIGFCIVTAPLCIATAVFDSSNRFFHWWLDLLLGALMTPIVFAISIALSVTLASSVVSALAVGPILAFVLMCGGLWFSSKMVHHLTWRHFSHGGAVAGFAAGVSTTLSPLHRLASAGFMAEALGANRQGTNPGINFMKRIGLASQGFNPLSGASPAMTAASGSLAAAAASAGHDLIPSDGPPDMTAALSASSRPAVAGTETVFAQRAFNAFAHGHAQLIGSLTRDRPFGSLSTADRAKLAWSRAAPRSQTAFADDFLSLWLGGPTSVADGETVLDDSFAGRTAGASA